MIITIKNYSKNSAQMSNNQIYLPNIWDNCDRSLNNWRCGNEHAF